MKLYNTYGTVKNTLLSCLLLCDGKSVPVTVPDNVGEAKPQDIADSQSEICFQHQRRRCRLPAAEQLSSKPGNSTKEASPYGLASFVELLGRFELPQRIALTRFRCDACSARLCLAQIEVGSSNADK